MKTEKIRKAKGSVLFTVVAVMTLLVVFMAGTMILVSSANHRSHINYSTAQTTITSRTVAESVLKALDKGNKDYEDYFFSVSKDKTVNIPVSISGTDAADLGTMGHIDDVIVSYEGTMQFYGTDEDEKSGAEKGWKERDVIKVLANVNLGRANSSSAIYLVVDPPNGDPGKSGNGAGFVTTGGAKFSTQTSLYGGAYINIPSKESIAAANGGTGYNYSDPDHKYWSGNQAGETDQGDHYVMHIQNSGGLLEADSVINGSLSMENFNGFVFPGKGKGVTIWGDMIFSSNAPDHFYTYVNADTVSGNINFNDIPFIYVDGALTGTKIKIEAMDTNKNVRSDVPLNVFCEKIDMSAGGMFDIRGDVYCTGYGEMDPVTKDSTGITSEIKLGDSSTLYSWSSSVVNKALSTDAHQYLAGDLISNGNVKISSDEAGKNLEIEGDLRVNGNLDLSGMKFNDAQKNQLIIHGDLVVGGRIIGNEDELPKIIQMKSRIGADGFLEFGNIYCDEPVKGFDGVVEDDAHYTLEAEVDPRYTKVDNAVGKWVKWDQNDKVVESDVAKFERAGIGSTDITRTDKKTGATEKFTAPYATFFLATSMPGLYTAEGGTEFMVDGHKEQLQNAWNKITYYVECDKDGNVVGTTPIDEKCWYYDLLNPDVHLTENDVATWHLKDESGNEVNIGRGVSNKLFPESMFKYSEIYPTYATKNVLLGITQLKNPNAEGNLKKEDTQVVMTMKEILESVVNPYDNLGHPESMNKYFTVSGGVETLDETKFTVPGEDGSISESNIFSGIADIYSLNANKSRNNCSTVVKNLSSLPAASLDYSSADGAPVIYDSCLLKNFSIGENDFKDGNNKCIVIKPEKDIDIIIDGECTIPAGVNIFVDDVSGGKKVNFYITPGTTVNMAGNIVSTVKYQSLVNSGSSFQIATEEALLKTDDEGNANPKTLSDYGISAPDVYFYGGTGSKLNTSNFKYWAANIVSPELEVHIGASSDAVNNTILYNGTDVSIADAACKGFIFGCCNAESTDFPNQIKVLYTPNDGNKKKEYETTDRSHWLKVLYYDEF